MNNVMQIGGSSSLISLDLFLHVLQDLRHPGGEALSKIYMYIQFKFYNMSTSRSSATSLPSHNTSAEEWVDGRPCFHCVILAIILSNRPMTNAHDDPP